MRELWIAGAAALALATSAAAAPGKDIRIDDVSVFPESLSAAPDGSIYVGSMKGIVFRAAPGAELAKAFIRPSAENGILSILGVLADARSGTLWICSAPSPLRTPPAVGTTSLMAFDLKTGKPKGAWPFPAPNGACNDITVARTGEVYATDTPNGRILRLKRDGKALELFAADEKLKGVDGIAFCAAGDLYVNIVTKGQILRVDRGPDGTFKGLTEIRLSQPVAGPDGMRLVSGGRFLLAEGNSGKIDIVDIHGEEGKVTTLRDGLKSPPGVTHVGSTAYGLEGKILYLIDPKLKGQDPGPFVIHAIPLPKP